MSDNNRAFLVGLVTVGCLLGLTWALFTVGRLSEAFQKRMLVDVMFDDAKTLKKGAPVYFNGVHVGTVNLVEAVRWKSGSVKEDPEGSRGDAGTTGETLDKRPYRAMVVLDIRDDPNFKIDYNDKIFVSVPFAMGDPDIRIVPNPGGNDYVVGGPAIEGDPGGDLLGEVSTAMGYVRNTLDDTLGDKQREAFRDAIKRARHMIEQADDAVTSLRGRLPGITDNIEAVTGNARSLTDTVKATVETVRPKVESTAENVRQSSHEVKETVAEARVKVNSALDNAEALTHKGDLAASQVNVILAENRPAINRTIDNISATMIEARIAMAKASPALETLRRILQENRDNIRRTIEHTENITQDLQAAATDLRLHPWKLMKKPSGREVMATELSTASDQAARAASQLNQSLARLQAILQSHDALLSSHLMDVDDTVRQLYDGFQELQRIEKKIDAVEKTTSRGDRWQQFKEP